MDNSHLRHILSQISLLKRNEWTSGYTAGIHNNWIRAFRNAGHPYEIARKERNLPYFTLKREAGTIIGEMTPWVLPSCAPLASRVCADKVRTQEALESRHVAVPLTRAYEESEIEKAYSEAFDDRDEVVIKAHNLSQGIGVFLNVDQESFKEAFQQCIDLQKELKRRPRVLVQEMVNGFEIRGTVIEGKLSDVILRIPAYVIGDGKSTIDNLIDQKNKDRESDQYLKPRTIKRDHNFLAHMKSAGTSLSDVPADGEAILLTSISNIGFGGETAIVTDLVSDEIKDLAVKATAAIPGLHTAGVDMMIDDFQTKNPKVLEINSFPHAYISSYATWGEAHNPLTEYLDSYFARDKFFKQPQLEMSEEELNHVEAYLDFQKLRVTLHRGEVTLE